MLIKFTTTAQEKKRKQKSSQYAMRQYGGFATPIYNNYLALILLFFMILHCLYSQEMNSHNPFQDCDCHGIFIMTNAILTQILSW